MTFHEAFSENMEKCGLPAPSRVFGTLTTATATIAALGNFVVKYGQRVTLREFVLTMPALFAAEAAVEIAGLAAGMTAAFYFGACLGSLIYATGHVVTHSSLSHKAAQMKIRGPWLAAAFADVMRAQRAAA